MNIIDIITGVFGVTGLLIGIVISVGTILALLGFGR